MAVSPPSGAHPPPDITNDLYNWNIVLQTVCLVIPSIFMAVRTAVRLFLFKKWELEDWLCIASWLGLLAYSSILSYMVDHGGGIHQELLPSSSIFEILYFNNVGQIVYSMSILITKISILNLFLGIFSPSKYSRNWWTVVVIMALNIAFYWGLMFSKIFQCWPRDAIWDKSVQGAHCGSLVGILDASGTWNTLSDITILALPLMFIWRLKLNREKKIGIFAVFAVGIIAPIFSIVGVVIRIQTAASPDLTYYQPRVLFYAEAEITSGVLCSCLPCLPRLYRWLRGNKDTKAASRTGERSYQDISNRRRQTMLRDRGNDTHFLNSDYIELGDTFAAANVMPRAVTTDISARDRSSRSDFARGQIWKSTDIRVETEIIESLTAPVGSQSHLPTGQGSSHPR